MKKDIVTFTIRVNRDQIEKFDYLCEYYGRSRNGQINWLIFKAVHAYEKENGKIDLEDMEE